MVCIYCGNNTAVINSRLQKRTNSVWRRRKCQNCNSIFTSLEAVDTATSLSLQNSRHLEPFSRDKLLLSVYDSLRHRKDALEAATALCNTIIGKMYEQTNGAIVHRGALVDITSSVLERFDNAAAVHYKAFHPIEAKS